MFSKQNILTTLSAAGITTVLSAGIIFTGNLIAEDKPTGITPKIAQPTLEAEGGKFTLKLDKVAYGKNDSPVLTFTATNPTQKPIHDTITVRISSVSLGSKVSRRPTMPTSLWNHPQSVALKAGETKTFTFKPDVKWPEKKIITISMQSKTQHDKFVQASRLAPRRASWGNNKNIPILPGTIAPNDVAPVANRISRKVINKTETAAPRLAAAPQKKAASK